MITSSSAGAVVTLLVVIGISQINCAVPPPSLIHDGSRWVAMDKCTLGQTLAILSNGGKPNQNCHCWGYGGYICDPVNITKCPYGDSWPRPHRPAGEAPCTCNIANENPANGNVYSCPS